MPSTGTPASNSAGSTLRRARLVHARRAAGEDQRGGLAGERLGDGRVLRHDLGVDLRLPHPAGDQLGVLRPVVDDEDGGRLHPAQGSQCTSGAVPRSGPHPRVSCRSRRVPARVRAFTCPDCSSLVPFDTTRCLVSDSELGLLAGRPRDAGAARRADRGGLVRCANSGIAACNWLTTAGAAAVRLLRAHPHPARGRGRGRLATFARDRGREAPAALPARRPRAAGRRPGRGPRGRPGVRPAVQRPARTVVIGHASGVVTIDLAEGDDGYREQLRVRLAEPYRTMLGHLRHETGHWYWEVLVDRPGNTARSGRCSATSGSSYADALDAALRRRAAAGLGGALRSTYATAHPWEDWAESFAHYLHIRDTEQTAAAYGCSSRARTRRRPPRRRWRRCRASGPRPSTRSSRPGCR